MTDAGNKGQEPAKSTPADAWIEAAKGRTFTVKVTKGLRPERTSFEVSGSAGSPHHDEPRMIAIPVMNGADDPAYRAQLALAAQRELGYWAHRFEAFSEYPEWAELAPVFEAIANLASNTEPGKREL